MTHLRLSRMGCLAALMLSPLMAQRGGYLQNNLVSDIPGMASHTDPNLVNAWGVAFGGRGPWWVNGNGTGLSLVYDGTGAPYPSGAPLIVSIPTPDGTGTSAPTGISANTSSDFQVVPGAPAIFLFSTEDGTISGWYTGTTASLKVIKTNAVYKGMTLGQISGKNVLYAANFAGATVDVFDGAFAPMTLAPGAFQDPSLPTGYAPFNVQNIAGLIYVAFAKQNGHDELDGPGLGYVDAFSSDGTLMLQFQHGDWMNAPWGLVMAPKIGFGPLNGDLLVGQFGSGQIAAFNPTTGAFLGMMNDSGGLPIAIDGLWGLGFGNGGNAGSARALYFSAGTDGEAHGLFGNLTFTAR